MYSDFMVAYRSALADYFNDGTIFQVRPVCQQWGVNMLYIFFYCWRGRARRSW